MPNTRSAKKALKQSKTKQAQNLSWKRGIREVVKNIQKYIKDKTVTVAIIKDEERKLYKVVDKAAKNKVIHKNKARRIKSRISKSISAHERANLQVTTKKETIVKPKRTKSKS